MIPGADASPRLRTRHVVVLALLALGLVAGWRALWFLTDDAFIAFRYAANHLRGWGYSWNPPPFRHVEGYTSFLWVVLLEALWRVTGLPPPQTANVVSLLFSFGTLGLVFLHLWRRPYGPALERYRFAIAASVVGAALTNRTFLAWTSSGLETALFGFLVTAWVLQLLALQRLPQLRRLVVASALASLCALARPDGMLLVAAFAVLVLWAMRALGRRALWALAPLAAVPAHLAWRRWYYGEWLPNTYFAKVVSPWPEAGLRYLASFILEYALWIWLAVALLWLVRAARAGEPVRRAWQRFPQLCAVGVLLAHLAYYTLRVGGDHFEYRVFAHLVPLLWLSFATMLDELGATAKRAFAAGAVALAASLPIPWTHYALTHDLDTRPETFILLREVAPSLPQPLRAYAEPFDALQRWLIPQFIGMRHQEHKVFSQFMLEQLHKLDGVALGPTPVTAYCCIGVIGWKLPDVAVIDTHGLNDRVVARSHAPSSSRRMAHERVPPPGYVDCFQPNVLLDAAGSRMRSLAISLRERAAPLDVKTIRACEARFDPDYRGSDPGDGTWAAR